MANILHTFTLKSMYYEKNIDINLLSFEFVGNTGIFCHSFIWIFSVLYGFSETTFLHFTYRICRYRNNPYQHLRGKRLQ